MNDLKGIIFDLDGTLVNTLPVCILAYQDTVQYFGHWTPTEDEVYAQFGPSEEGLLEAFLPGKLEETLPYFLEMYEKHHDLCCEPFPGVVDLLKAIHACGKRAAIVTGKGRLSADITLRILGIDPWLDAVETGFADRADKPHSMRTVLEGWGFAPSDVAYVGDMPSDMDAAIDAGVLPVGAAWAETSTLRGASDTHAAVTFYEIDSMIRWLQD